MEPAMKVLFQNQQWRVTTEGIICDQGASFIEAAHLSRLIWPKHMADKWWVYIDEFVEAFEKALELHKGKYAYTIALTESAASIKELRRLARENPDAFECRVRTYPIRRWGFAEPASTQTED
jgi:hypothetical protein